MRTIRPAVLAAMLAACHPAGAKRPDMAQRPASPITGAARTDQPVAAEAELSAKDAAPSRTPAPGAGAHGGLELPAGLDAPTASMVVRTGNASLEVDSLDPAVASLRDLALRVGGYVGNASLQGGAEQYRAATLELKVPAARFDEVVAGLRPLGRLEYANVSAEDVGEEYVDVDARAANARRLEERLTDILATRTGRLADVLAVERELARVREEIERLEGRLRYLRSRAALCTLSVSLHEPRPIAGEPGRNPIADALRAAWRNFVALTAGAIAASGFLAPLALLAGGGIFLVRRLRPRSSDAR
jgi:hypothetical protein